MNKLIPAAVAAMSLGAYAAETNETEIKPTKPMVMEEAQKIPPMGRFAIRDMGQTVAAGLCLKVTSAE